MENFHKVLLIGGGKNDVNIECSLEVEKLDDEKLQLSFKNVENAGK